MDRVVCACGTAVAFDILRFSCVNFVAGGFNLHADVYPMDAVRLFLHF